MPSAAATGRSSSVVRPGEPRSPGYCGPGVGSAEHVDKEVSVLWHSVVPPYLDFGDVVTALDCDGGVVGGPRRDGGRAKVDVAVELHLVGPGSGVGGVEDPGRAAQHGPVGDNKAGERFDVVAEDVDHQV